MSQGNTLDQDARLFAQLNVSLADAIIGHFDAKYTYNRWWPITAIRLADQAGNPATVADPTWTPLLGTPPNPSYVSGHAAASGAAGDGTRPFLRHGRHRLQPDVRGLEGRDALVHQLLGRGERGGEQRGLGRDSFPFRCHGRRYTGPIGGQFRQPALFPSAAGQHPRSWCFAPLGKALTERSSQQRA